MSPTCGSEQDDSNIDELLEGLLVSRGKAFQTAEDNIKSAQKRKGNLRQKTPTTGAAGGYNGVTRKHQAKKAQRRKTGTALARPL